MAVEFPAWPLGASLLHEKLPRETEGWMRGGGGGGGGGEEERAEREDGVLSAKCSLNREERTMGGKNPTLVSFFSNISVINM